MQHRSKIIKTLLTASSDALKRAIAPYSGFHVGAALLTDDGLVFTGCNIENPSLMMSICAEKVAIVKALSEGQKKIKAIMIQSADGNYCPPCGSCRQLIHEFAPEAEIYLASKKGIKKYSIKELLPDAFTKE
ncbi:MAG: cytidine deaminase [Nitrospirae bacterium]|nr:cytidine deaminase [Nitrospirota bacterium]